MLQLIDKKNRIIIYLIFLIILSTTSNKNIKDQKKYSLNISQINITGISDKNNLQLLNKLNNFFYKNIFFIEKREFDQIISEYKIVEEYSIKKIYPSILNVDIKPTKIIARISGNKKLLIGSNGKLIITETNNKTLPLFFGEFRTKKFLKFKESVESSKFNFTDFKSIFFYPSNRWDIITNDDILIKLPENNLLNSLDLANKIIGEKKFKNNKVVDLRILNHLIIQ
jgi:cell division protein FtsQ